jgi:hypothetical protein
MPAYAHADLAMLAVDGTYGVVVLGALTSPANARSVSRLAREHGSYTYVIPKIMPLPEMFADRMFC